MDIHLITSSGYPLPLGARIDGSAVQFSIFSRHASSVSLVLFESTEPDSPFQEIALDPIVNKTGDIWHIRVEDLGEGQLYGYRMDGLYAPQDGYRFNKHKLLLDPYAKAVTGNFHWDLSDARGYDPDSVLADLSFSRKDSAPGAPKCIVIDTDIKSLDRPKRVLFEDTIIYELHVKGFTYHGSSGVEHRGTYRGIIEKIPYLLELGVTAVELMPVQEFDEDENININPDTNEKLKNYWGYSTISFFAPRSEYSSSGSLGQQIYEFRDMVKALHKAGIEVILDVVFNHTAEGDQFGSTLCFRGIDNLIYYVLENDKRYYKNFSGCGNTFNCNHPLVRDFIIDCLKYWVMDMHVDGFRFDLASILGRDQDGRILSNPPLIEHIAEDPILRSTKIIAEAWDAAGAYQVGDFPGRWAEWNGEYRNDVRSFWKGDWHSVSRFATRVTGSSDLYQDDNRSPLHSINFITCHDGFTLNDLTSYGRKHNLENGEGNRDGENNNLCDNYGIEGNDATPYIEQIRLRQVKNFIATLFLSLGVPMLLAGDEFRRTQKGNNNAYCQDNEISWLDWSLVSINEETFRFCREMIRFRREHPILRRSSFFSGTVEEGFNGPDISWHGTNIGKPDWSYNSHFIACLMNGAYAVKERAGADNDIYIAFNASRYNLKVDIPIAPSGGEWYVAIDTSKPKGEDIVESGSETVFEESVYQVKRLSTVVLFSKDIPL